MEMIREAPLGQVIRFITRNKYLKYPEEMDDFECPSSYKESGNLGPTSSEGEKSPDALISTNPDRVDPEKAANPPLSRVSSSSSASTTSQDAADRMATRKETNTGSMRAALTRTRTREATRAYTRERFEVEQEEALERAKSMPIAPQRTSNGDILVDWYTTDDPANPQNWTSWKKAFVGLQILCVLFPISSETID